MCFWICNEFHTACSLEICLFFSIQLTFGPRRQLDEGIYLLEDTEKLGERQTDIFHFNSDTIKNENFKVNCNCSPVALTLILHTDCAIVDGCVGVSVYHSEGYLDKYEDIT